MNGEAGGKQSTPSLGNRTVYFVSDAKMLLHECEWDENHIEKPSRVSAVLNKLKADREKFASNYDDVYFNKHTFLAASVSAGCSLKAMETVLPETARHCVSFALVRPPGHHASRATACGFCIFNNVAICAKKARKLGAKKVLIIDWDVHAAQGTQYAIADDPCIKLISIHRYEYAAFWPNLPESAIRNQYKNTINVPLNVTGLGDSEYIAFVQHFVVPIIYDFAPSLILISCGYDAAYGDPEGLMKVTPAGYYWMTKLVTDAAAAVNSSLCVVTEGGYFVDAVANGVLFTLKALFGDTPPDVILEKCNPDFLHSLYSAMIVYASEFPNFQLLLDVSKLVRRDEFVAWIEPIQKEFGEIVQWDDVPYPTRNQYSKQPKCVYDALKQDLEERISFYTYESSSKKAVTVAVVEKPNADEESNELVQLEAGEQQHTTLIEFLNIHIFNTPGAELRLSERNVKKDMRCFDSSFVQQDICKLGRDIIHKSLCKLFDLGFCKVFKDFLTFEVTVD